MHWRGKKEQIVFYIKTDPSFFPWKHTHTTGSGADTQTRPGSPSSTCILVHFLTLFSFHHGVICIHDEDGIKLLAHMMEHQAKLVTCVGLTGKHMLSELLNLYS